MSKLYWYWHRLRAMSAMEMALHARKKFHQFADARRLPDWTRVNLECSGAFPKFPKPEDAPPLLRKALQSDVENISAGRWKAFGHLELKVDDPPQWHCDYLVGKNFATTESAFKLNYRELPDGADIKLIWELSRWHQLVRLAMAAYVLGDERAGRKCVEWLEDWVKHNPPYCGWNWTSALEVGMRLIQFTWIDALLSGFVKSGVDAPSPRPSPPGEGEAVPAMGNSGRFFASDDSNLELPLPGGEGRGEGGQGTNISLDKRLDRLRCEILPPHVWFAWRHKSFGSSANNHLLGELAGLILATVRWPEVAKWGAPLEELQTRWEHEVLAQFAEDGGNKEQALNYQLFSFELCWQTRLALLAAGREFSPLVEQRLDSAARFFWKVQAGSEPWDYGDSDSAFVTPLFTHEETVVREWRDWIGRRKANSALDYWLGEAPETPPPLGRMRPNLTAQRDSWWCYRDSGIAVCESGFWWLRWDLSPLGYLGTAAHGHLDALHLSIWFNRVPFVIDPGTGAYFANQKLRTWLASRAAHNGPCPVGEEFPKRLGPFLWSQHHDQPVYDDAYPGGMWGALKIPQGTLQRSIVRTSDSTGWVVNDGWASANATAFTVRWQFAPGATIKILGERKFAVNRYGQFIVVEAGAEWAGVKLVETESERSSDAPLAGVVSPAFRKICFAPYLLLTAAAGDKPCVFRTTFLASAPS